MNKLCVCGWVCVGVCFRDKGKHAPVHISAHHTLTSCCKTTMRLHKHHSSCSRLNNLLLLSLMPRHHIACCQVTNGQLINGSDERLTSLRQLLCAVIQSEFIKTIHVVWLLQNRQFELIILKSQQMEGSLKNGCNGFNWKTMCQLN